MKKVCFLSFSFTDESIAIEREERVIQVSLPICTLWPDCQEKAMMKKRKEEEEFVGRSWLIVFYYTEHWEMSDALIPCDIETQNTVCWGRLWVHDFWIRRGKTFGGPKLTHLLTHPFCSIPLRQTNGWALTFHSLCSIFTLVEEKMKNSQSQIFLMSIIVIGVASTTEKPMATPQLFMQVNLRLDGRADEWVDGWGGIFSSFILLVFSCIFVQNIVTFFRFPPWHSLLAECELCQQENDGIANLLEMSKRVDGSCQILTMIRVFHTERCGGGRPNQVLTGFGWLNLKCEMHQQDEWKSNGEILPNGSAKHEQQLDTLPPQMDKMREMDAKSRGEIRIRRGVTINLVLPEKPDPGWSSRGCREGNGWTEIACIVGDVDLRVGWGAFETDLHLYGWTWSWPHCHYSPSRWCGHCDHWLAPNPWPNLDVRLTWWSVGPYWWHDLQYREHTVS